MRIIKGINYYYKLEKVIKECIDKASHAPFEQFIFICEDKKMIEKKFLQYTHLLVNIEIMTWNQFLQSLQIQHHLTKHKVIDHTTLVYYLRQIFNEHSFHCFHTDKPYPLIKEMIPLLKELELNQTIYDTKDISNQPKLLDFINIYQYLKEKMNDTTHLCQESIFCNHCLKDTKKYIYIEADHLYQPSRQNMIKQLSKYHDITLLYTYKDDQRLFNLPYQSLHQDAITIDQPTFLLDHIFSQTTQSCPDDKELYTFVSSTPQQEVNQVVYTILQKIADEHLRYQDFMIIYPDSNYNHILLDVLNKKDIPHHLPVISSCVYDYSYQTIIKAIDELDDLPVYKFAEILSTKDIDYEYKQYLQSLSHFKDIFSKEEFKEFFIMTCINHHKEINNNQDHIQVVSIEKAKTDYKKHIFFVGMNETVFPHIIKDTSLLLDEDIQILRSKGISTPLLTLEKLGIHNNDIIKALQCPYLSMTFSYSLTSLSSETKLPSSLYKQLNAMYHFKPLAKNQYLPIDEYYLTGGQYENKKVNEHIKKYKETKNQPVILDKDITEKLYSSTLSVSQIETYNKCPYLYFIQYGLGLYPSKEDKLKANELGSLVHYVLSICMKKNTNIDALVNYYIQKNENLYQKIQASSINQYFIEQLKKDLVVTIEVLTHFLDQSMFNIHSLEEKVEDEIAGMKFKGFVDRCDIYSSYLSIIDYKSSHKDIDLNLAMQGFNIQMLIYLQMMIKKYDKDPAAVLYFNTKRRILASKDAINSDIKEDDYYSLYRLGGYIIDDDQDVIKAMDPSMNRKSNMVNVSYVKTRDEYTGHILTKQQFKSLEKEIEKHIYELYIALTQGHIEILPKGSDQSATHTLVNPCRFCDYHSVCHFDVFYNNYKLVEFYDVEEKLKGE